MTSATQLTLVPPASNVRSVSYRRLTDEPPGASEWYNMLERLGLKVNYSRLSGEEITKVREGVVETLRTLDKNYYGSFCAEAHGYFNRIEMKEYFQAPGRKNEDILDEEAPFSHVAADSPLFDLPHVESVRKEYEASFEELRHKQQQARIWEDRGVLAAGGLGVVVGAIIGGEVAEYIAQSEAFRNFADYVPLLSLADNSERVASAVAGLLVGAVFWAGTSIVFQRYGTHLRTLEQKVEQQAIEEFTRRVGQYIRQDQ